MYVLKYLSQAELETLMKDVARHVHTWSLKSKEKEPSRHAELSETCVRYIEHMLEVVTEYYNDVSALVSLKWYAYLGETLHGRRQGALQRGFAQVRRDRTRNYGSTVFTHRFRGCAGGARRY
jgi:hypothetical protein